MKFTRARTKREAIVIAVTRFNKLKRLESLNARIRGTFKGFMNQEELKGVREDAKWEAIR